MNKRVKGTRQYRSLAGNKTREENQTGSQWDFTIVTIKCVIFGTEGRKAITLKCRGGGEGENRRTSALSSI